MSPIVGVLLWALVPGFIALVKGRSFLAYYLLSLLITPLVTMIITICLSNLNKQIPIAPNEEILACLNEVADNPEAIKALAKDMRNANEINNNEYQYIIECYIDNAKPAMQDESLYEQPKSYEDVVSMCDLLGNNIEGKKDVILKAFSSGTISLKEHNVLYSKYVKDKIDQAPDNTV